MSTSTGGSNFTGVNVGTSGTTWLELPRSEFHDGMLGRRRRFAGGMHGAGMRSSSRRPVHT
eukprot:14588625-Alexandrium_andersonii.AAC.1